jgi:hypothetical protein
MRGFSFPSKPKLSSAVASSFDTSNHCAIVVGSILRNLTGLLRCPLLALGAIRRLLRGALTILRVHENLTGYRTAGTRAWILLGTRIARRRPAYIG